MTETRPAEAVLTELGTRIGQILAGVERIGELLGSVSAAVQADGRMLCRDDVAAIRPLAAGMLRAHSGIIAGAGAVLGPGVLADAPRWLEWWWPGRQSGAQRLRVDLDPASAECSDYTSTEWYRVPSISGRWTIVGPYVDYICTHQYTFTLSTPVRSGGMFLGVAGADILAAQVERLALPALCRLGVPAILVSAAGRVIASNTASLPPGAVGPAGQLLASSSILPWQVRNVAPAGSSAAAGRSGL